MPRGKKTKRNKNEDELTAKLMRISLKMDDHIYCNKLISAAAAENYLQEIASLKLKCSRTNVRALQVIEKLTRYMKGIIIEDQIHDHSSDRTDQVCTEFPGACSPVYSITDEDKTELNTAVSMMDDNPTIDLTEDEKDQTKAPKEQENLIDNVNNAIANMAIQDEAETMHEDYSQSILESFQNDNAVCNEKNNQRDIYLANVPNNLKHTSYLTEIANNRHQDTIFEPQRVLEDSSQRFLDISCHENTICIDASQVREFEDRNISNSNLVAQPLIKNGESNSITNNDTFANTNSLFHTETLSFLEEDPLHTVDLNRETALKTPFNPPASKCNEKKKIVKRKKNKDNNNVTEKRKPKVKNTITEPRKKEKHVNTGKKALNIVIGRNAVSTNISVNKPEVAIYNKNVENDLSWIENLRFVRELSPEENDPTLVILEDNFWDNFSLPQKWNDLDFET